MKDFKGTSGDWSADIGADELHDDLIQVMVTSDEDGFCVAHAFGRTYDEAMANARMIAKSTRAIELLNLVLDAAAEARMVDQEIIEEIAELLEDEL